MKELTNRIRLFALMLLSPLHCLVPCVTSADLTTLSELMKQVYDPVIEEQQNLEPFTWNSFEDGDDELGGQGWYFETKMGGNQEGIGARDERDDLPVPGYQRWKQGIITWKLCYGAFELTGPVIEAARNNLMAFANARTEEIEGLTRDVIKDFNRQIYGDGNGVLATCNGVNTVGSDIFDVYDGMYLRKNMQIDIANAPPSPITDGDNRTIEDLSVNADGTWRVTTPAAETGADPADGDVVFRTDSYAKEMMGFEGIIDDGTALATYQNIARATYPLFKGNLLANGGTNRNLTLDLLQQAEDAILEMAGKRPNWIRMNLGQRRKMFDLISPDRRYNNTTFDAGYENISYNGLTFTIDIDHPKNEITWLTKESIKKYSLRKFGLIDFDGLVLRQVTNKDVWRGYIGVYGNTGCKRPNCNARLTDLVEPTTIQRVRG
jgi:hypothetical protein